MPENVASRQIFQDILQGGAPARPLFAPIAFALASRVENLPLRSFLGNPTKICNALRQIRGPLQTDAVTCYFDPLLEVEALGATIEWAPDHAEPGFSWTLAPQPGDLPDGLVSADDVLKRGRLPIVLDVIRRLKTILRDEFLLMAVVSGPLTLAARLVGWTRRSSASYQNVPGAALEVAAATITELCKAFAEAGANLVLLKEEISIDCASPVTEDWFSTLTSIFKMVRFYEALPVLQIVQQDVSVETFRSILNLAPDCCVCISLEAVNGLAIESPSNVRDRRLGIALPTSSFQQEQPHAANLEKTLREVRPVLITSADDLPNTTNAKRVAAFSERIRTSA